MVKPALIDQINSPQYTPGACSTGSLLSLLVANHRTSAKPTCENSPERPCQWNSAKKPADLKISALSQALNPVHDLLRVGRSFTS